MKNAPPFRIPNGTNVTIGDWVGIVLDQSGPNVRITSPHASKRTFVSIHRDHIVKVGRHYEVDVNLALGPRTRYDGVVTPNKEEVNGEEPVRQDRHP